MKFMLLNIIKKISLLILFVALSNIVLAQSNNNEQTANNYNIPPGAVLKNKLQITDYSYKLSSLSIANPVQLTKVKFTSFFEGLNLEEIKSTDKVLFEYYETAENYYSSLSDRVKASFTLEELWHIYFFDARLKEQLSTIK
jgi:hypothetical protein